MSLTGLFRRAPAKAAALVDAARRAAGQAKGPPPAPPPPRAASAATARAAGGDATASHEPEPLLVARRPALLPKVHERHDAGSKTGPLRVLGELVGIR